MLSLVEDSNDENKNEETKEGVLPNVSRKPGSGRIRSITSRPEILQAAQKFSESAGVSAHERRRSDIGHFGFTMPQLHSFIQDSCYHDNPDQAPSLSTVRRMFEPPNINNTASAYYKSDIKARPGSKKNDAPSSGKAHPHRHECSAVFKMSRYCNFKIVFFSAILILL